MRIRIHEIEIGTADLLAENIFFRAIGVLPVLEQENITVFDSGIHGLDVNVANHLLPGTVQLSFLTDDLKTIMEQLLQRHIFFEGPFESHLGMLSIKIVSPNNIPVIINTPTDSSPAWLRV